MRTININQLGTYNTLMRKLLLLIRQLLLGRKRRTSVGTRLKVIILDRCQYLPLLSVRTYGIIT